jgi:hypothetical protein
MTTDFYSAGGRTAIPSNLRSHVQLKLDKEESACLLAD